jgi:hypothetical protein
MIKFFRQIRQNLLSEGKTGKYLKYAIGEIILVVIGILIALQINNWNEEKKSAIQETLYLKRLLAENKEDLITFMGTLEEIDKGIASIEGVVEAFKANSDDAVLILRARDYLKYGSIYPVFTSSTSTFEDLSSTGNLKVIRNSDLRDAIVKHYAKHKKTAERIQIAINWALPIDTPFTYENDIMKFEPTTSFLYPKESNALLASELRDKKMRYISNAAVHYWIDKDASKEIEDLKLETSLLITKLENALQGS